MDGIGLVLEGQGLVWVADVSYYQTLKQVDVFEELYGLLIKTIIRKKPVWKPKIHQLQRLNSVYFHPPL